MGPVTSAWVAFAALGAGLVHLALVVGAPWPVATALLLLGAAELIWGVSALRAGRPPLPRVALAVAIAPIAAWMATLALSAAVPMPDAVAALRPLPLAATTLLGLIAAVSLGAQLRRERDGAAVAARDAPSQPEHAGRYLVGMLAGALVVAALVTPALAGTEAGLYAQPHGEHPGLDLDLFPSHHGR